mmetsp:Transcript_104236/g.326114  ORF Transcript_104236/g.326114 Transcript_104236/m.326114 type:complete len:251 (+) Transcript_104236:1006-1758(+)
MLEPVAPGRLRLPPLLRRRADPPADHLRAGVLHQRGPSLEPLRLRDRGRGLRGGRRGGALPRTDQLQARPDGASGAHHQDPAGAPALQGVQEADHAHPRTRGVLQHRVLDLPAHADAHDGLRRLLHDYRGARGRTVPGAGGSRAGRYVLWQCPQVHHNSLPVPHAGQLVGHHALGLDPPTYHAAALPDLRRRRVARGGVPPHRRHGRAHEHGAGVRGGPRGTGAPDEVDQSPPRPLRSLQAGGRRQQQDD